MSCTGAASDDEVTRRSKRSRTRTERGAIFEILESMKKFKNLRKQLVDVERKVMLAVDQGNIDDAKNEKAEMSELLSKVDECYDNLTKLGMDALQSTEINDQLRVIRESTVRTAQAVDKMKSPRTMSVKTKRTRTSQKTSSSVMRMKLAEAEVELKERKIQESSRRQREEAEKKRLELEQEERRQKEDAEKKRLKLDQEERQLFEETEARKAAAKLETFKKYCDDQELGSDDPDEENDLFGNPYKKTDGKVDQPLGNDQWKNGEKCESWISDAVKPEPDNTPDARCKNPELVVKTEPKESSTSNVESNPDIGTIKMLELLMEQNAPEATLQNFSGDPLDYRWFRITFESEVESKVLTNSGRLNRLLKYTEETLAHDIVAPFVYDQSNGYYAAKEKLKQEYENENVISTAYQNKIREWPMVKPNSGPSLKKFCLFLNKVKYSLDSSEFKSELNSQDNLRRLSAKLPVFLQDRWNRKATDIYDSKHVKPNYEHFLKFVETESNIVNNPTFSRAAMGTDTNANPRHRRDTGNPGTTSRGPPSRGYNNNWSGRPRVRSAAIKQNSRNCNYCGMNNHALDTCFKFRRTPHELRKKFIYENKLCYSCLRPCSHSHTAKTCTNGIKCTICQNEHPTCLHPPTNTENPEVPDQNKPETPTPGQNLKGVATGISSSVGLSCVLVEVKSERTGKIAKSYCFLDSLSNGSFIDAELRKELDLVENCTETVNLSTMSERNAENSFGVVRGVKIMGASDANNCGRELKIPKLYCVDKLPVNEEDMITRSQVSKWEHLRQIAHEIPEFDPSIPIGLLLGNDVPRALEPHDVIKGTGESPYAVKYLFGWSVAGPIIKGQCKNTRTIVARIETEAGAQVVACENEAKIREGYEIHEMFRKMYEHDFQNDEHPDRCRSQDDHNFMEIMEKNTKLLPCCHYEMPLPTRGSEMPDMPDNEEEAKAEAYAVRARLRKGSEEERKRFVEFMRRMERNDYARKIPEDQLPAAPGKKFYLTYHSVRNPKKPGKTRVVYNCARKHKGVSLNDKLMTGPTAELGNNMIGVQARWREEEEAYIGDIEDMFYMNKVPENQRAYLRYFWWDEDDLSGEPQEYYMCVHLFGAASSPSCANFALKRCADDNASQFSESTVQTVKRNFYVDDCLQSSPDKSSARASVNEVRELCKMGGYNLRKFVATSKDILADLPEDCKSKTESVNFESDELVVERVLGSKWIVSNDELGFEICLKDRPCTKRGLLASISSIFDPMGLVSPYLLEGRKILQALSATKLGWDEPVNEIVVEQWQKWVRGLKNLETIKLSRCYKPKGFGKPVNAQLHSFSDASEIGYGCGIYIRLENAEGEVSLALVMGKSRVTPLSGETIARSELVAATIAAELASSLSHELTYENLEMYYWTDSEIVLAYLKNETKKFKTFVTNRLRKIRTKTSIESWKFVKSEDNVGDDASRGLSASKATLSHRWFQGPDFLRKPKNEWQNCEPKFVDLVNDCEVKKDKITVNSTNVKLEDPVLKIVSKFSEWFVMKHVIASLMGMKPNTELKIGVEELKLAEINFLKAMQMEQFSTEIECLKLKKDLPGSSRIAKLDPYLDPDGILRISGRLEHSGLDDNLKNPVILPKFGHVTDAIIRDCHAKVAHCGRNSTLNELRNHGYWIVDMNSRVRYVIQKCVHCKKTRGKIGEQKMAQLPKERFQNAPPYSYCGVDFAGPFITKSGRKEQKRYLALFTDLVYRGVHLEVCQSLETDSLICGIRRFVARRGNLRYMRSDNGSNFIGYTNEMKKAMSELEPKLREYLLKQGCDLEWTFNTPTASHQGGIWERPIGTVRRVLESVLRTHPGQLNDEGFCTLLTEVECIVNCRPLTVDTLSDVNSPVPLSPMNILTRKTKVVLPPFGNFDDKANLYCRKQWRRVQHLTNEIWIRFRKEYLSQLQEFAKWNKVRRNMTIGDVVLLMDDSVHRNHWPMARVVEVYKDKSGLVRNVKIRMGRESLEDAPKYFNRPITKLILILESEIEANELENRQ